MGVQRQCSASWQALSVVSSHQVGEVHIWVHIPTSKMLLGKQEKRWCEVRGPPAGLARASLAGSTPSRIKCPGGETLCLGVSLYLAFCSLEHQFRRSRKSLGPVSLRATVVSWATLPTNSLEKRRTLFYGASPGGKDIWTV
jgi:hypothetical protein